VARVLVTGGAGFIGSHLAKALVEGGDAVRILDNFSSGRRDNIAEIQDDVELIESDLRKVNAVAQAVKDVEFVFHEAAFVSVPESIEKPQDCYATNVSGTIDLLEAARQAGVRQVVLASSAAVYGANPNMPLSEAAEPETPSPYAASKFFNEVLAKLYTQTHGLPVVALRYFNVYGPRQSPHSQYAAAIPRFIEKLAANQSPVVYGDGSQTRDFVFVGDVVEANLIAISSENAAGRAFNVCSGVETSLLDLLAELALLFPNAPKPEFAPSRLGDVPRSLGDASLAANQLGFIAKTSLRDGLAACAEAWQ
jgi:UDP-glucose 4-epimerase